MNAATGMDCIGVDPTAKDLAALNARWITPELAKSATIRRVDSVTGREMVGRKSGNLAGLLIPFVYP